MAVELRRHIERGVGEEYPATLAMDHPQLCDVVDYMLGDVLGLSEQAKSGPSLATAVTTRTDEQHDGPCRPNTGCTQSGSVLGNYSMTVSMPIREVPGSR